MRAKLNFDFAAQTFPIITNVDNSCAAKYFCGNVPIFFFQERFQKNSIHLKQKSFVTV